MVFFDPSIVCDQLRTGGEGRVGLVSLACEFCRDGILYGREFLVALFKRSIDVDGVFACHQRCRDEAKRILRKLDVSIVYDNGAVFLRQRRWAFGTSILCACDVDRRR